MTYMETEQKLCSFLEQILCTMISLESHKQLLVTVSSTVSAREFDKNKKLHLEKSSKQH